MSHTTTFLWASRLLCYPDAELKALAQGCEQTGASSGDTPTPPPAWASAFLQHVAVTPLLELQEDFVQTFDLNAAASLYLTTHVYGDSPLQGRALAALLELYREGGCDPILGAGASAETGAGAEIGADPDSGTCAGELPDYLPMALEFLAMAPPWAATCLCEKFAPVSEKIAVHLREAHSPWADMLHAVAEGMRACVPPEDAESAEDVIGQPATVGKSVNAGQPTPKHHSSREVSV